MTYLKYLKYYNKLSEIHLWQFTNDTLQENYLNSITNLHKTNGKYSYYRNIYPYIYNNNYFIININLYKNKACLLINDKYEISFEIVNNLDIIISLNVGNKFYYGKQSNFYDKNLFFTYIIKIINFKILIKDKTNFLIKTRIDENYFSSIKIKSIGDAETIWDYKERINKDIKLYDTRYRRRGHWYEMYRFYLNYDFDILIKMDDDISFIDINRFEEFTKFIKNTKKNVTIPNLVNHAVSLYYNNKLGLIPNYLISNNYQNKTSSLDVYNYFKDGEQAKKIHHYFLRNINKFIKNNFKPIKLNRQKPSICMFGITKVSYNYVYNPKIIWPNSEFPKNYEFDDEVYTYRLSNNYFYPKFVSIHYAFGPQRDNGLDEFFLKFYKKISLKYILN